MPTQCRIVSHDDGLVRIAEPPTSISDPVTRHPGRVILWFTNTDRSIVKACDRPVREDLCSEEVTTYESKDDGWVRSEVVEILSGTG